MVSVTYKNFIECTYFDVKHYGYRNHSLDKKRQSVGIRQKKDAKQRWLLVELPAIVNGKCLMNITIV